MAGRGKHIIFGLLMVSLVGRVFAQGTDSNAPIELSFSVFAPRPIKNLHYAIFDDEGSIVSVEPLNFRTGGRSVFYRYKGPREILFFRSERGGTEDRVVVGRAEIPENLRKALFVFMPSSGENENYRIYIIDDSLKAIPWGDIAVFNATEATLQGVLGSSSNDPVEVLPGQNSPIQIAPKGRVRLAYRFRDAHWQLVYSENLNCNEDERLILLILPPRSAGARQLRGAVIKDYRIP